MVVSLRLNVEVNSENINYDKCITRRIKDLETQDIDKLINFIYMYLEQIEFNKEIEND